ncbi:CDP-alcohol phosphatidyltransferase family protein [Ammonicoccus fulvus]|uniref:CDP-alcohol phosphatidyltransferase family protein n=1 Tax=Ammonicoccus fulvus TaxID=3138240 RepID=A0ABZ3FS41_9ACTN
MDMSTRTGAAGRLAPLTPADWVTVTRAAMGAGAAVLVVLSLVGVLPQRPWSLFLLLVPTFALDAVDGAVARRTNTVTRRGAMWDMEVDSALLLIASLAVAPFAPWALAIGLMRYAFGIGGRLRPAWRGRLPFNQVRRVIAGFQAVALATALAPFVPILLAQLVTGLAVALLFFSFGRDIRYLERHDTAVPQ